MKPDQSNSVETEKAGVKKNKLSFEKFFQQFNTLDMQAYGSWPQSVKLTCWIFIFSLVCLLGYFVLIEPKRATLENAQSMQQSLLNEFKEKESKLRNLKQYQAQLVQMQSDFEQQLAQLPKETEIPSLVEDIHDAGQKSGLKIKNIRLEDEVKQAFFIEQPILIEAQGDYHDFGQFVSRIAALPRIVTLHDVVISTQTDSARKSDIPRVEYSLKAKTYRYVGSTAAVQVSTAASTAATATSTQVSSATDPSATAQAAAVQNTTQPGDAQQHRTEHGTTQRVGQTTP